MILFKYMKQAIKNYGLLFAWVVAVLAMLGSLYFSEVLNLPPCVLCWYQRICMYPLVIILGIGIWTKDKKAGLYGLALSAIGLLVSIYHNLLYYKILPENIAPCSAGISCTTKQLEWFGFLTIPLMALGAFTFIVIILTIHYQNNKNVDRI